LHIVPDISLFFYLLRWFPQEHTLGDWSRHMHNAFLM
jgi:hypothetical protein